MAKHGSTATHGTLAWVAEKWARGERYSAAARHGQMFFDEASIFSWGRHYELGRLDRAQGLALVNVSGEWGGQSPSTQNHRKYVWAAADRAGYRVLEVQAIPFDVQAEINHQLARAADHLAKAGRARQYAAFHAHAVLDALERAAVFVAYGGKLQALTPDPKVMAKLAQRAVRDMITTGDSRLRDAVRQLENLTSNR